MSYPGGLAREAMLVDQIAATRPMRGVFDELGLFQSPQIAPGTPHAQLPLINRVLGSTGICPTMNCDESPAHDSAGNVVGSFRGPCEAFWRPDRPRAYVALALMAGAGYGAYRLVKRKR